MKLLPFLSFIILIACQGTTADSIPNNKPLKIDSINSSIQVNPYQNGGILIGQNDCLTCHQVNQKSVGPTYEDIAARYSEKDIDSLAHRIINGSSGIWGETPMSPHPTLSKEEATEMAQYIISLKK